MHEKHGMMKNWNIWLIFSTFLLCIFGTLLTRYGIVSSVHAFGKSSIGAWFGVFLLLVLLVCLVTSFERRHYLKTEHKITALVSRESSSLQYSCTAGRRRRCLLRNALACHHGTRGRQ